MYLCVSHDSGQKSGYSSAQQGSVLVLGRSQNVTHHLVQFRFTSPNLPFIQILTRRQSDGQAGEGCAHSKNCSVGYGGNSQLRCVSGVSEVRILGSKPNLIPRLAHHHDLPLLRHANVEWKKKTPNYKTAVSNSTHTQNCTQFFRDDSARLFKKHTIGITLEMWERGFKSCCDPRMQTIKGTSQRPGTERQVELGRERSQSAADITVSSSLTDLSNMDFVFMQLQSAQSSTHK